jgi:hypothetical protein
MRPLRVFAYVILACWMTACEVSDPGDPVIKSYEAATCVPLSAHRQIKPRTREWQSSFTLHDGSEVVVSGAQAPGGRIAVTYPASHRQVFAADPGDYVYPSDVRLDARNDRLFVKANGLAGGISDQTWLFEYDLDRQQLVRRERVKPDLLSAECPDQE